MTIKAAPTLDCFFALQYLINAGACFRFVTHTKIRQMTIKKFIIVKIGKPIVLLTIAIFFLSQTFHLPASGIIPLWVWGQEFVPSRPNHRSLTSVVPIQVVLRPFVLVSCLLLFYFQTHTVGSRHLSGQTR